MTPTGRRNWPMPEFIEQQFKSIINKKKFIDSWFWDRYTVNPTTAVFSAVSIVTLAAQNIRCRKILKIRLS